MCMNPVFVKAEEFLEQQLKISFNHIVHYFGILPSRVQHATVINSSINLFQQGLRFEKNQTEDDMDKVRQKYCELASRELSSS